MDRSPHGTAVLVVAAPDRAQLDVVRRAWLAGYSDNTARNYWRSTDQWLAFCDAFDVHPLKVHRSVLEMWGKELAGRGLMDSSIAKLMGNVKSFYAYATLEGFIDRDPVGH